MPSASVAAKTKWWVHKSAAEQAQQAKNFVEAERNWLAALEEAEDIGDEFTLQVTLENLSTLYFFEEMFERAAPIVRRIMRNYQKALGDDHPDVAIVAANLATLYHSWGKYPEAAQYYQHAIAIKTKTKSEAQPEVVQLKSNLASVLNKMSLLSISGWMMTETCKTESAKPAPEGHEEAARAVAASRKELKPQAGDTGRTLGWKMMLEGAIIGKNKKDYKAAEKMYERAVQSAEQRLGPTHVVVAYVLLEFAEFYFSQREYDKAHTLYERAGKILTTHADAVV